MKQTAIFFLASLLSFSAIAQEVILTSVEVRKGYPETAGNQSIQFGMVVLTDVSTFTKNLDNTKSVFTKITDDTGFDLLAAQNKWEAESKGNYWYFESKIENWGPLNDSDKPGFIVNGKLAITPSSGAKTVNIQGIIAMINYGTKESTYTLKDISTGSATQTEIGEVFVNPSGSIGNSEASYEIYSVISDGKPISSLVVAGGDDREEAAKSFNMNVADLDLGGNGLIFKTLPEKLDLEVVAKDTEIKEIPFDIDVAIGF